MTLRSLCFGLLMSCLAVACSNNTPQPQPAATATPLSVEIKTRKKDIPNVAGYDIAYPVVTGGAAGVADAINKEIQRLYNGICIMEFDSTRPIIPVEAAIDTFEKVAVADHKEIKDLMPFELEISAEKSFENAQILTLSVTMYQFMGGAHPNSYTNFLNFDVATGKLLTSNDLVSDAKGLLQLLDSKIKNDPAGAYASSKAKSYGEAGYFIENEQLPLPQNIELGKDTVIFMYNTYEIAAYAVGATVIELPTKDVQKFLKVQLQ